MYGFDDRFLAKQGDTLESISIQTNVPVCVLQRANSLHPLFRAQFCEGDSLFIPEADYCVGRGPCDRYILDELLDYNMLVDEGDTIYKIASDTGIPVRLILLYNDMDINDSLPQIIYVPDIEGFKKITVNPEDTLESISDTYNIPVHVLMFINALITPVVFPGQQLMVPEK